MGSIPIRFNIRVLSVSHLNGLNYIYIIDVHVFLLSVLGESPAAIQHEG